MQGADATQKGAWGEVHLVLGGARSGKSAHAQRLAAAAQQELSAPVLYVATCRSAGLDAEMKGRIERHREERPAEWETVEDRFDWRALFAEHTGKIVLVDCVTLWLAHQWEQRPDEAALLALLEGAIVAARENLARLILVSNELGLGLVPLGAENRAYRDLCGRANQRLAARADRAEFIVAGLPLKLK